MTNLDYKSIEIKKINKNQSILLVNYKLFKFFKKLEKLIDKFRKLSWTVPGGIWLIYKTIFQVKR